jgi:hypothetical protein
VQFIANKFAKHYFQICSNMTQTVKVSEEKIIIRLRIGSLHVIVKSEQCPLLSSCRAGEIQQGTAGDEAGYTLTPRWVCT